MEINEAELRRLYERDGLTMAEIAGRLGLSVGTVRKAMRAQRIAVRAGTDRAKIWHARKFDERPHAEIRRLYEAEHLSISAIATRTGLTSWAVRESLLASGVEMRAASSGLAYRGLATPTEAELRELIAERLTLKQIAVRLGSPDLNVIYWLKKYGLKPLSRREGIFAARNRSGAIPEIPGEAVLREWYGSGLTLEEIADKVGCSRGVIAKEFRRVGIPIRPDGYGGGKRHRCRDGHEVRSTYERRVDDWLSARSVPHSYEPVLPGLSRRFRADFLANGWYIEIWGMTKKNARYDARRTRKEEAYRSNGLPMIGIEHWDFNGGRDAWERKLSACLTPAESDLPLFRSFA